MAIKVKWHYQDAKPLTQGGFATHEQAERFIQYVASQGHRKTHTHATIEDVMTVSFIPIAALSRTDEHWSEHVDHWVVVGEMTTDHPASSYGLPVIVCDGIAHGPRDVYKGEYSGVVGATRDHAMEEAAFRAGFRFAPNQSTTSRTY